MAPRTAGAASLTRPAPTVGSKATSTPMISSRVTPWSTAAAMWRSYAAADSPAPTSAARRTSPWVRTSSPDSSMLSSSPMPGAGMAGPPAATPASQSVRPVSPLWLLTTRRSPPLAGEHVRAQFVEADNMQCKFLEPVQQSIKFGLIAHRRQNAGPAPEGLDFGLVQDVRQHLLAVTPHDDPVAAAVVGGPGHDLFLRWQGRGDCLPALPWVGEATPL